MNKKLPFFSFDYFFILSDIKIVVSSCSLFHAHGIFYLSFYPKGVHISDGAMLLGGTKNWDLFSSRICYSMSFDLRIKSINIQLIII